MERLKGFIVGRAFPDDPNYVFGKIKRHGVKSNTISLADYLKEEKAPKKNATMLIGEDFTLCLTDYISAGNIKYLSVIEKCAVFEIFFTKKLTKLQIFKQGEMIGERVFPLTISLNRTKKILGIFGKEKETQNIEQTVLNVFDTFAKAMHLKSPISSLLRNRKMDNFVLESPSKRYILPGSFSTNATPFYGDKQKIMDMMPLENGLPLSFETDFDDTPMTQEKYCERIIEYVRTGVVSPAVLIQHNPLCISVYSSDLDAVLIMNFKKDSKVAKQFKHHKPLTKFLSVNMYASESSSGYTEGVELDIIEGPNSSKRWKNFTPHVIDFLVDDRDKPLLDYWKQKITEEKWQNTVSLTKEYFQRYPGGFRIGFLMCSEFLSLPFARKFYPEHLEGGDK